MLKYFKVEFDIVRTKFQQQQKTFALKMELIVQLAVFVKAP